MAIRLQIRRGSSTQWSSANPVLSEGELGLDTTVDKIKIGDGATAWNSLAFAAVTPAELSSYATTTALSSHESDTTNIHGIVDTALLATQSYADSAVSTHSSDTTNVHGITDTALLATQSYADSAVSTHSSDTTNVHGITDTSLLATQSYADSAVSTHSSDSTNVHGIVDTANLVLTNDARLSDSRTPTHHAASHGSSGSDPITIAQSQVTNLGTDLSAKAPLSSPTFTGIPAAPTATVGTNTTQIATTEFVRTEVANLVASAPSTLDTLDELAAALGDDANYATTISTALGGKEPTITSGTTSQYWRGDKSWQTLDKSSVGLGSVENTALSTWAGSANITSLGTIANGIWQGTAISSTYIDSAIARLASPTFTGTVTLPSDTAIGTVSATEIGYLDGVTSAIQTQINDRAPLSSPSFTGTMTAQSASFTGTLDVQEIRETINSVTLSSNIGTFDWTTGNIFFVGTAPTGNMTFNFTNVPTDNDKIMSLTVFVTQGSTGYIPTTVNINGSAATIKWTNGSTPVPTSTAGKIDIFAFSLIRISGAWNLLASSSLNF